MELALEPAILGGKNKVPVATRASVVTPMWNCGIVTENSVKRDAGLVVVAEIFCPGIDFFLPGRVPGHFAAERIRLRPPAISPGAHFFLQIVSLLLHPFAFKVHENLKEDVTYHLTKNSHVGGIVCHRDRGLIGMVEIPIPRVIRDQAMRVPCQMIEDPISRGHVRIIVGAINLFGRFFVPTGPRAPVEVAAVRVWWHLLWLVVEKALAHAVRMR